MRAPCACAATIVCWRRYLALRHGGRAVKRRSVSYPRRRDDEKLIIRVDGHLTCSIFGEVLDIWDCSERLWIVIDRV